MIVVPRLRRRVSGWEEVDTGPPRPGELNSKAEAQRSLVFQPSILLASNGFRNSGPNPEDLGATRMEEKGTVPGLSQESLC